MKISFEKFQSIVGAVADANQARNAGHEMDVQGALKAAATIFHSVGLVDVVTVRELPYDDSARFQLWGEDENAIAYTIAQEGIVFS